MALIEMTGVGKSYAFAERQVAVLRDVTLAIRANEYVAVVGSAAPGRSTLMNILGCLDWPTSGEYRLNGQDTARLDEAALAGLRNREVGFVFQDFNLIGRASAVRNVTQPLVYRGIGVVERHRRAAQALAKVGLSSRMTHLPNQLSGGDRQRVAIARAIVGEPAILLADEPTANLDRLSTDRIMALLGELRGAGQTLIVFTHEADIAARAERVIELEDGRIVEDRTPEAKSRPCLRASCDHKRAKASLTGQHLSR